MIGEDFRFRLLVELVISCFFDLAERPAFLNDSVSSNVLGKHDSKFLFHKGVSVFSTGFVSLASVSVELSPKSTTAGKVASMGPVQMLDNGIVQFFDFFSKLDGNL